MLSSIRSAGRTLSRDQRGASIIEFAIAAPVFALLVVGIGDLARGFSDKFVLQQVVNRTLQRAQTGSNNDHYGFLETVAETAAADAGIEGAEVVLNSWVQCGDEETKYDWDFSCAGVGDDLEVSRYVQLTITSSFTPAFNAIQFPGMNDDGEVPISATAALRVQ